jgi:phospholipid/cholesterol/gamma-HCH transport system substrate-binding protein
MNQFKVGLLALATMASVIYMSIKVTSNQSGFGDYQTFRTIVKDASGIFPKTSIKVAGINAGRIKRIELQGTNALITFEVLKNINIPINSKLKVKTVGFLGDKYLEIRVGDAKEHLDHMGFLLADEGGGIETIVRDAQDVLKDVKVIVTSLKEGLAPKDEPNPIKVILADVKDLVKNVKDVSLTMKNVISGNEEKFQDIVDNIDSFTDSLAYQLDAQEDKSVVKDVKKVLANVDQITTDLKDVIADLKSGKGTLGKLLVEEEIADEVKETLAGVKKIVGKVDTLRTQLSLYTGANTNYGSETDAELRIYPAPERFYSLGVTTSKFGPVNEKSTTTVTDGVETNQTTKERQKNTFRFNVQLGRKIQNWSFRGGLIESSGGVGVDYDVQRWGSVLSMDVYDYREDIGVNLRLSTETELWNVFYGKLAFEDLIEESRSATVGIGLRFNDEDLKGLIAFFL